MIVVLDASVVLKWFVQEPESIRAIQYKERYVLGEMDIFAPDLLLYEVANVLRFKHNMTESTVKSSIRLLLELGIDLITPTEVIFENAIHIAYKTGLSVYDSWYLALASDLNCSLITADTKVHRLGSSFCRVEKL